MIGSGAFHCEISNSSLRFAASPFALIVGGRGAGGGGACTTVHPVPLFSSRTVGVMDATLLPLATFRIVTRIEAVLSMLSTGGGAIGLALASVSEDSDELEDELEDDERRFDLFFFRFFLSFFFLFLLFFTCCKYKLFILKYDKVDNKMWIRSFIDFQNIALVFCSFSF